MLSEIFKEHMWKEFFYINSRILHKEDENKITAIQSCFDYLQTKNNAMATKLCSYKPFNDLIRLKDAYISEINKTYKDELKLTETEAVNRIFDELLKRFIIRALVFLESASLFCKQIDFLIVNNFDLNFQGNKNDFGEWGHNGIDGTDEINEYANTLLHELIANEKTDKLAIMVKKSISGEMNVNWNAVDANNKTAFALLLMVYKKEHLLMAEQLLKANLINVNCQDYKGNTPLHIAIYLGQFNIVKLLLTHPGIDLTLINKRNVTPLEIVKVYDNEKETNDVITNLLASVSVDPDRDINANFNRADPRVMGFGKSMLIHPHATIEVFKQIYKEKYIEMLPEVLDVENGQYYYIWDSPNRKDIFLKIYNMHIQYINSPKLHNAVIYCESVVGDKIVAVPFTNKKELNKFFTLLGSLEGISIKENIELGKKRIQEFIVKEFSFKSESRSSIRLFDKKRKNSIEEMNIDACRKKVICG